MYYTLWKRIIVLFTTCLFLFTIGVTVVSAASETEPTETPSPIERCITDKDYVTIGNQTEKSVFVKDSLPSYIGMTLAAVAEQEYESAPMSDGQKYWGEWYGYETEFPWCACFVSYCAEKAGMLQNGLIQMSLLASPEAFGLQAESFAEHTPRAGDIAFFDTNNDPTTINHVGIVVGVNAEDGIITVVEGNFGNALQRTKFSLKTGESISYPGCSTILCYGIPDYWAYTEQEGDPDAPLTQWFETEYTNNSDTNIVYNQRSRSFAVMVPTRTLVDEVKAYVWTAKDGKDDVEIIDMKPHELNECIFTGEFYTAQHNDENGEYLVAVYLYHDGVKWPSVSCLSSMYLYPEWDVNGDGYITEKDNALMARYLKNHALNTLDFKEILKNMTEYAIGQPITWTAVYNARYDVNRDNIVDLNDLYRLYLYTSGKTKMIEVTGH